MSHNHPASFQSCSIDVVQQGVFTGLLAMNHLTIEDQAYSGAFDDLAHETLSLSGLSADVCAEVEPFLASRFAAIGAPGIDIGTFDEFLVRFTRTVLLLDRHVRH